MRTIIGYEELHNLNGVIRGMLEKYCDEVKLADNEEEYWKRQRVSDSWEQIYLNLKGFEKAFAIMFNEFDLALEMISEAKVDGRSGQDTAESAYSNAYECMERKYNHDTKSWENDEFTQILEDIENGKTELIVERLKLYDRDCVREVIRSKQIYRSVVTNLLASVRQIELRIKQTRKDVKEFIGEEM